MVVALLSLCVALGGTAGANPLAAASKLLSGKRVKKGSLPGNRLKKRSVRGDRLLNDTVTGKQVKESTLAKVPLSTLADNANTVGGQSVTSLRTHCPDGTFAALSVCFENSTRAAATWFDAQATCGQAGRRLPTIGELFGLRAAHGDGGPEMSSTAGFDAGGTNSVYYLRFELISSTPAYTSRKNSGVTPDTDPFRCVAQPAN
jgi:hypothetical protein